jgi:hypothetical protein
MGATQSPKMMDRTLSSQESKTLLTILDTKEPKPYDPKVLWGLSGVMTYLKELDTRNTNTNDRRFGLPATNRIGVDRRNGVISFLKPNGYPLEYKLRFITDGKPDNVRVPSPK